MPEVLDLGQAQHCDWVKNVYRNRNLEESIWITVRVLVYCYSFAEIKQFCVAPVLCNVGITFCPRPAFRLYFRPYVFLSIPFSFLHSYLLISNSFFNADQDHLRLCRIMSYEVDVPGFPTNNTQQHTAIKKALNSRFSLIQGPPGTIWHLNWTIVE